MLVRSIDQRHSNKVMKHVAGNFCEEYTSDDVRVQIVTGTDRSVRFTCCCCIAQTDNEIRQQLQDAVQRLESSEYHWETETESSLRARPPLAEYRAGFVQMLTSFRTTAFNQPAEALIHGDKAAFVQD